MNEIVIEHVPVADLPEAWRDQLGDDLSRRSDARVTVRIEAEPARIADQAGVERVDDPLFGMWRDREDIRDVAGYVRRMRAPRFGDGEDA